MILMIAYDDDDGDDEDDDDDDNILKIVISAINPQLCPAHPAKTTARTSGLKN